MKSYTGIEPYAFLSYSHKDIEKIEPVIDKLQKIGCNIWYDEGIEPTSEWAETIAKKLGSASMFFVVISKNSIESQNVKREIYYAVSKDIPILAYYLEEVDLPDGLSLQLGISQAIYTKGNESDDCNLILNVIPKKLKTEPKEILYSGKKYIYYFKTDFYDNFYTIERYSIENKTAETIFHHKESIYGTYKCHSVHYAKADEFHTYGKDVLFFEVLANVWPDDVPSAPDFYYNIRFAVVQPDSQNAELKIEKCQMKHVDKPYDGRDNATMISEETITANHLDKIKSN